MCVAEDDERRSDSPMSPIRLSQEILHCQSFVFFCSYLTNSVVLNTFRQLPLVALMRRSACNWSFFFFFFFEKYESLVAVVEKDDKWFIVWWSVEKKSSNERHADLLQTFIQQVQAAGFGPNGWPKPSWSHEWHLFKPVCTYLFIWSRYVHAHPHTMWFAQVMSLDPHPLLLLEQYSCQLIRGVSGPQ